MPMLVHNHALGSDDQVTRVMACRGEFQDPIDHLRPLAISHPYTDHSFLIVNKKATPGRRGLSKTLNYSISSSCCSRGSHPGTNSPAAPPVRSRRDPSEYCSSDNHSCRGIR